MNNYDNQYLNLVREIVNTGSDRPDRTGIGSRAIWHYSMNIDLSDGFPIITHRKVALRIAFEEIMWMLRGCPNSKILEDKNIKIWKGNTSREFLDNVGLSYLPEGSVGKAYPFQWRNFGGDYLKSENGKVYNMLDWEGIDQVYDLLEGLKKDPNGRRHIITAWNPMQTKEMALPACHLYQQYQILDGKLNSAFLMRSNDVIYGLPYNIMGYALLNHMFADYLGLKPGILGYTGMDVHIYLNQLEMADEIVNRTYFDLPILNIKKKLSSFEDIISLEYSDIELNNYNAHNDLKNKAPMAV